MASDIRPMTEAEIADWPYRVQCCRTCAHSNDADAVGIGHIYCTLNGGFYNGKLMQMTARCERYERSEP